MLRASLLLWACLLLGSKGFALDSEELQNVHDIFKEEWELFKVTHGKKYANEVEEKFRLNVYLQNRREVAKHNIQGGSYSIGINAFSDMTFHEFSAIYNGFKANEGRRQQMRNLSAEFLSTTSKDLPSSVDWRMKGAVTPVKNQGSCGSCWAFGATGSLESMHFRKTKSLVPLSEQNMLDCATREYNCTGCAGGDPLGALFFIRDQGGQATEKSYPYTATEGKCKWTSSNVGATVKNVIMVPFEDEKKLELAVAEAGPVVVAIRVEESFRWYSQGVYYDPNCPSEVYNLNHAVLVVGYGTENGEDFWIVKNSWGASWGENGYIRMAKGRNNACGIATYAGFPVV